MLIAVPIWEGRVSPVFDVARRLWLVTVDSVNILGQTEVQILDEGIVSRVRILGDHGVNTLLCGAISGCTLRMLDNRGIRVVPHTCGPADEVLRGFLSGQLVQRGLVMPGCVCGIARGEGIRMRRRCGSGRPQQPTKELR